MRGHRGGGGGADSWAVGYGLWAVARISAVLALSGGMAGCGRTQLARTHGRAEVAPSALDFGKQPVLFPAQQNLTVQDAGNAALHLGAIASAGSGAAAFSVDGSAADIASGSAISRAVIFKPPAAQAYAATLTVESDDADAPAIQVRLTGEGVSGGVLAAAPASLDFGRVGEGESATRTLTLASTGTSDLYLGGLSFTAATAAAYAFVGSPHTPSTLAAGAQVSLAVRFAPLPATVSGLGAVAIDSSDPAHAHVEVPLTASINRAPIPLARGIVGAGAPQAGSLQTAVGVAVQLDSSGTRDPDGDLPLTLHWTLSQRPVGSAAAVSSPDSATAALLLDAPGLYTVLLDAADSTGLPDLAPSRLDIRAIPPEQLVVRLVWDQIPPDLDLHLLEQGAQLGSSGDCGWTNPQPVWFSGGPDANPSYGGDALEGFGPETISWKNPAQGSYTAAVVYTADHGSGLATTATVSVFTYGVLSAAPARLLSSPGDTWMAVSIAWPSGQITALPAAPPPLPVQR